VFSHPIDWMDAFFPIYPKAVKSSHTPHHLTISKPCRWSNEKAALLEMGTPSLYHTCVPFSTGEFEQYMYLRYFNGLNPSPRVEDKLQTEANDPVQSNPFLCRVLGPNASLRYRHWKCCFSLQDPKIPTPSRKTHPNFKVDEYLRHLQIIWRYA
jgi:hypothetical protein